MQQIAVSDLKGRIIVTSSGSKLGQLKDVVIDADSGRVVHFVASRGLLGRSELLIGTEEVVEITASAIVVKDTFVSAGTPALA